MIQVSEIQAKIAAILAAKLPLWDLYEWLEQASWDMHVDSSQGAMKLAAQIKILFSDYYAGVLSEKELRAKVLGLNSSLVPVQSASIVRLNFFSWVGAGEPSQLQLAVVRG